MREKDFKERLTGLFCLFSRMSLNTLLMNLRNSGVDSNYYGLNNTFGWGLVLLTLTVKSCTDCCSSSHYSYCVSSLSSPLQVQRSAGQLWYVSTGGQEVPVRLVQQRGPMHHEAALCPHLPLHQSLAKPFYEECQVHQPAHYWGLSARFLWRHF